MNTFLSIIIPSLSIVGAGGLALLFITQVSKSKNYTPSMIAIGRLMAIGVPLGFIIDLILSVYVRNNIVIFTIFIIEVIIAFILCLNLTIKIKKERRSNRR